jgi:hypothetical protein
MFVAVLTHDIGQRMHVILGVGMVQAPLQKHQGEEDHGKPLFGRCVRLPPKVGQAQMLFDVEIVHLDVIVTTHKTIGLVFHTQVYKLKRDMTRKQAASALSVAFMHHDVMEVNDESPAHSPTTDGDRPAPVGAPPQGAQDHSGTPGGQ